MAQQFVGEVRAVLEEIQHTGGQCGIAIQALEQRRSGKRLLQKVIEAFPAAVQARGGHYLRQSAERADPEGESDCWPAPPIPRLPPGPAAAAGE